ncbi:alpha/beta hydrolase [Spirosoma gilvum]
MKTIGRKVLFGIIGLVVLISLLGLILAFFPTSTKTNYVEISPEEAVRLRQNFTEPHHQFITSDGVTLFLRRWNPDTVDPSKKDIAVLIFHGITAHSGAYEMAGKPLSAGGYTTFGLDYRGHGLSDGNRGDSPGRERWTEDLAESVRYIKKPWVF